MTSTTTLRKNLLLLALAVAAIAAARVTAQPVDASRVTPRDLRPEPSSSGSAIELPLPPDSPSRAGPEGEPSLSVTIDRVRVQGGFPDMEETTAALIAPFHGRRSSTGELSALADALEAAYSQAGYLFARVTIPPQQVVDGDDFRLQIIDGYVDSLNLDAIPARQRRVLRSTLKPLIGQKQLRVAELESALLVAGDLPGLVLRSTLVPGEETGATTLVLEAEHNLLTGNWSTDNRLSQSLGGWQSNLQLQLNQVLGRGEQFYAYFSGHPNPKRLLYLDDRRRVGGIGVSWPVGRSGMSLNLEVTASDTFVETGNPLIPATRSRFRRQSLRLSAPLRMTRASRITWTGILEHSEQSNAVPLFQQDLYRDKLRIARMNLSLSRPVLADSTLNLFLQYSQGLDAGARGVDEVINSGVPFSRPGSRPDFSRLEFNASLTSFLPREFLLISSLRAQYAFGQALPTSELFSMDGEDALSAMVSGRLSADAGWTVRSELSRQFALPAGPVTVTPFAYISGGIPQNNAAAPEEVLPDHAASAGLGLRARGGPLRATLEYGRSRTGPGDIGGTELFASLQVVF
ncbi:MAG: ShlB/FhaC/HecB family hemolysin secretion/activation protein [Pseudohongiellaceae bacterium]